MPTRISRSAVAERYVGLAPTNDPPFFRPLPTSGALSQWCPFAHSADYSRFHSVLLVGPRPDSPSLKHLLMLKCLYFRHSSLLQYHCVQVAFLL